jgi:hypothetical protein
MARKQGHQRIIIIIIIVVVIFRSGVSPIRSGGKQRISSVALLDRLRTPN